MIIDELLRAFNMSRLPLDYWVSLIRGGGLWGLAGGRGSPGGDPPGEGANWSQLCVSKGEGNWSFLSFKGVK